mmetsp:Transcript_29954/g.71236  ORF Transcript_29954/g.71236 Transcript_29954/m.71236 type:complete len:249 (-) Transcript_29954:1153-1899(-)
MDDFSVGRTGSSTACARRVLRRLCRCLVGGLLSMAGESVSVPVKSIISVPVEPVAMSRKTFVSNISAPFVNATLSPFPVLLAELVALTSLVGSRLCLGCLSLVAFSFCATFSAVVATRTSRMLMLTEAIWFGSAAALQQSASFATNDCATLLTDGLLDSPSFPSFFAMLLLELSYFGRALMVWPAVRSVLSLSVSAAVFSANVLVDCPKPSARTDVALELLVTAGDELAAALAFDSCVTFSGAPSAEG